MSDQGRILRLETLKTEASAFARQMSAAVAHGATPRWLKGLFFAQCVEDEFYAYLSDRYAFTVAPRVSGGSIDLTDLGVEIKVQTRGHFTALHPQTDAEQSIYGLGVDLLLFVVPESWVRSASAPDAQQEAMRVMFIAREYTCDHNVTTTIVRILDDPRISDPDLRRDTLAQYLKVTLRIKLQHSRLLAERVQARRPKIGAISLRAESHWQIGFYEVLSPIGTLSGVEELSAPHDLDRPGTSV